MALNFKVQPNLEINLVTMSPNSKIRGTAKAEITINSFQKSQLRNYSKSQLPELRGEGGGVSGSKPRDIFALQIRLYQCCHFKMEAQLDSLSRFCMKNTYSNSFRAQGLKNIRVKTIG